MLSHIVLELLSDFAVCVRVQEIIMHIDCYLGSRQLIYGDFSSYDTSTVTQEL